MMPCGARPSIPVVRSKLHNWQFFLVFFWQRSCLTVFQYRTAMTPTADGHLLSGCLEIQMRDSNAPRLRCRPEFLVGPVPSVPVGLSAPDTTSTRLDSELIRQTRQFRNS